MTYWKYWMLRGRKESGYTETDFSKLENTPWEESPMANVEIYDLHVGEGDVVLRVTGKVSLDESLCLCESLVPTTTEEGNAREAQQCGDEGAIWHPTQTTHTAVIATCESRHSTMK